MNVIIAACRAKFELPPRSISTNIAINMIERIANIPMVIRRDTIVEEVVRQKRTRERVPTPSTTNL
jgi:hypothetical protein